jgi:peptidoglycan/xylan/chitin deacetylase (PgdA/CDA1 family)
MDPGKPMVALTFDDGPSKHTARILDLLERYNARATFCTVGNLLGSRRDTVARAAALGCEVIGHSWDHKNLTKLTDAEIKKQLLDTSAAIEAITGVKTRLYRPPYGAVSDKVRNVSRELGFAIINWSVDPLDWKTRDADAVYNAIMRDVADRAIVLSHDSYATTAAAMERVIPELISQGYQLVTVSELLSDAHDSLTPGQVYRNGR